MKAISSLGIALAAGAVGLAGCAEVPNYQSQQYPSQQYPSQQYPSQQQYPAQGQYGSLGTVQKIELIGRGDQNNVAGTVIGGIIGGLIGSQVGGGSGKSVATIAGIAGGAYAGNQIEKRQRTSQESIRVTVRMDSGSYQTVTADQIADLQTGDRVRVDGNSISRY